VLSGNDYPTNAGIHAYTSAVGFAMNTNTTYWLVASNSATSGNNKYYQTFYVLPPTAQQLFYQLKLNP
jgi:hypothetical protein